MIAIAWGDGSTGITDYAASPLKRITSEVARKHGFSYAQVAGRQRLGRLVRARHEAFWRCRKETTASLGEIALLFGKDHSGVKYGIERHEERMKAGK